MSFLTSLVSAFKGGGGSRVPVARGFISPWATAFDGGPLGRSPFDYAREVAEAYLANPVAQRSVRIVAEGVGSAPVACEDDRLAGLLARSCGSQPLLEVLAAQLALHGNAYVQLIKDGAGVPVELYPLRPERVQVVAGEDGCTAATAAPGWTVSGSSASRSPISACRCSFPRAIACATPRSPGGVTSPPPMACSRRRAPFAAAMSC
ncbi:phage portal protein [Qipengyuania citrea]|uniref:phage portal protein n=1 Tax=Qipengyuania citrea TaxID=225971 RepID=UPI003297F277